LLVCTLVIMGSGSSALAVGLSYSEAINHLKKEQSQAETYAVVMNVMKPVGTTDLNKYARGILLYGDAKAEFDGLIEQMKAELMSGNAPETSPKFEQVLHNAVDRSVAFKTYVANEFVGTDEGKKGLGKVLLGKDLLPLLIDTAKGIWTEYREASKERKQEILAQLDALKWKPFHELPGSS